MNIPPSEAELVAQIQQPPPPDIQQRYRELREKLQAEILTDQEHQELLTLIDTIEQADADRLQQLITLAQMRQDSFPDLMTQLGLQPPPVYAWTLHHNSRIDSIDCTAAKSTTNYI